MQFLKTLFWVLVAVAAMLFAFNNWTDTEIALWNNMVWATKLPVPLFFAFLLGLVPTLLLHRTTRWSLKRKISTMERALAEVASPSPAAEPKQASGALPPSAAPIAVPPGVA